MKNLKVGNLSKDELYVLVKGVLDNCKVANWEKKEKTDLHHNSSYKNMQSIVSHGILSIDASIREGLYETREQGIDNVNGRGSISVSIVEEPLRGQDYYVYDFPTDVNFVISDDIRKIRKVGYNTENYSNEILISDSVPVEYFKCIEVRLLKLINLISTQVHNKATIENFIEVYNYLIDCIQYMIDNNINTPLVEASDEMMIIDKQKLLSYGKMVK